MITNKVYIKTLSEVDAVLPLEVVVQYPLSELPLFSTRGSSSPTRSRNDSPPWLKKTDDDKDYQVEEILANDNKGYQVEQILASDGKDYQVEYMSQQT